MTDETSISKTLKKTKMKKKTRKLSNTVPIPYEDNGNLFSDSVSYNSLSPPENGVGLSNLLMGLLGYVFSEPFLTCTYSPNLLCNGYFYFNDNPFFDVMFPCTNGKLQRYY